jgi:hypothetical protein
MFHVAPHPTLSLSLYINNVNDVTLNGVSFLFRLAICD